MKIFDDGFDIFTLENGVISQVQGKLNHKIITETVFIYHNCEGDCACAECCEYRDYKNIPFVEPTKEEIEIDIEAMDQGGDTEHRGS